MTIEEMRKRKQELGYSNEQLAKLSGVPLGTVMKIFGGATKTPRHTTIQALEKVLKPHTFQFSDYDHSSHPSTMVHETPFYESSPHIKRICTIDDYYALPDDRRVELIDGVFYDMAVPSFVHQGFIGEIYIQLKACERKHQGACKVFLAPCDVQLDCDRYTMVQPDLIVICDPEKQQHQVCFGAPDLVIEVLSPSGRSHDCVLKLHKYRKAGVREYWIVDPEAKKTLVYIFPEEDAEQWKPYQIYDFSDKIPIYISGGECSVDFAEIERYLEDVR